MKEAVDRSVRNDFRVGSETGAAPCIYIIGGENMRLIRMECPYCGANLQAEAGTEPIRCEYCGSRIAAEDEVKRSETTVRIHDEAKLREAQLKEQRLQEEEARRKNEAEQREAEAFRKGKRGKLVLLLMVICGLGAFAAFGSGHVGAGILAVLQVVLLLISWLVSTGYLKTFRGRRLPAVVFTVLACALIYPYSVLFSKPVYPKLHWPSSGLASELPMPNMKYGKILADSGTGFRAELNGAEQNDFDRYRTLCEKKGYVFELGDAGRDIGYNEEEYRLEIEFAKGAGTISVMLDAPPETAVLSWPVSEFSASLPEPASLRGVIHSNEPDYLDVTICDMSAEDISAYIDLLNGAAYAGNFQRSGNSYRAEDESGEKEVSVEPGEHQTMRLELRKVEKLPEPTAEPERQATPVPTQEPAAEPTTEPAATPEPSAESVPSSGVRPEFRKLMEDYEAFYDRYIEFMKTYSSSSDQLGMMQDYLALLQQLQEWEKSIDDVDESTLTPEEDQLYLETTMRVLNKLNQAAYAVN